MLESVIPIIEEIDFETFSIDAKKYEISNSRMEIIQPFIQRLLDKQSDDIKRIILNGHDLKFVGEFESYLKIKGQYRKITTTLAFIQSPQNKKQLNINDFGNDLSFLQNIK